MKKCEKNVVVTIKDSLRDVMSRIEESACGFAVCVDLSEKVVGVITDGDLRRAILEEVSLDACVERVMSKDFIFALDTEANREALLKLLDHKIKFVPVLDELGYLKRIVTPETLALDQQGSLSYRSRAPVRVSFGGGGSDVSHYFYERGGAVMNACVSLYTHVSMIKRRDGRVVIHSEDLGLRADEPSLSHFLDNPGELTLFAAILSLIKPDFGFDVTIRSDFPIGSGLGGSATVAVAFLGCFNLTRDDQWDSYEIAEIAYQAERLLMGISGGWQDQYAAAFGGFNFIEFGASDNIVNQISINPVTKKELEANLILCDLRSTHDSGAIHDNQRKTMADQSVIIRVDQNVRLCSKIKNALVRGRLESFGELLHEAWSHKKNFSTQISNDKIDALYDGALKHGAVGGKLLGAGGGGFFLFFVPPELRAAVESFLVASKCSPTRFHFDEEGLTAWTARRA